MSLTAEYLEITFTNQPLSNQVAHSRILPFINSALYESSILSYRLLTTGEDVKKVYDIAIDLKDVDFEYKPGDAIAVLPKNDRNEVDLLIKRLKLIDCADKIYCLSICKDTLKKKPVIPPFMPVYGTLRDLLLQYVDIRSVPKKIFLRVLLQYTSDEVEKQQLEELCDPKSTKFGDFVQSEKGNSLLNLLTTFQSAHPPIERLLEHLPALLPRYYSVVSSKKSLPSELHVAFSVIGVCTTYMENLGLESSATGKKLQFYFRKSSNFLKEIPLNTPVILVGPGTGVAPFLAFLEERADSEGDNHNVLFFGCRYPQRDFLYREEIYKFLRAGVLKSLHTAYSRDSQRCPKTYVQDKIVENGAQVCDLILQQNCFVCVCGDKKNLLKSIEEALITVLVDFGGLDKAQANDLLSCMKKSNRYQLDIWT